MPEKHPKTAILALWNTSEVLNTVILAFSRCFLVLRHCMKINGMYLFFRKIRNC
jgi:hypothetical protein